MILSPQDWWRWMVERLLLANELLKTIFIGEISSGMD